MPRFTKTRDTGAIVLAWMSPGKVDHEFADCLLGTLLYDAAHDRRIVGPNGGSISLNTTGRLGQARSKIVQSFLEEPEHQNAEWLWMADTDMVWDSSAPFDLIDSLDKIGAKVGGALCFGARRFDKAAFPTIYELKTDDEGVQYTDRVKHYPKGMVQCAATGAAFLMMHRSVLVDMGSDEWFGTFKETGKRNPTPWFQEYTQGDRDYGEDIAFCMRCNHMGVPIFVNTEIVVGHMKTANLDENAWKRKMLTDDLSIEELAKARKWLLEGG